MGKIKGAIAKPDAKTVALEYDNLILTKYNGLRTVFEKATFTNLTPRINRMRLIKSADEIQKMLVAGQYADKAVNMGSTPSHWIKQKLISSQKSTLASNAWAMK